MEMEFWEEVEKIGKLYVEEELVVGIEPVLQVCVDQQKYNRYLVMTYDSGEGEFVLCRIAPKALLDMLENRKTMEETFRAAGRIYVTSALEDGRLKLAESKACEFPADKLPDKGAYYDISSEYIQKYIKRLKNVEMEVYETIEKTGINLSNSSRRKQIRYDLPSSKKDEYTADYQDACSNKYSTKYPKFSAA